MLFYRIYYTCDDIPMSPSALGLGELPRLMLEVTGTAYDSVMYFDTKEYKDIGPFGQMPLLKDPPIVLLDEVALLHVLARSCPFLLYSSDARSAF